MTIRTGAVILLPPTPPPQGEASCRGGRLCPPSASDAPRTKYGFPRRFAARNDRCCHAPSLSLRGLRSSPRNPYFPLQSLPPKGKHLVGADDSVRPPPAPSLRREYGFPRRFAARNDRCYHVSALSLRGFRRSAASSTETSHPSPRRDRLVSLVPFCLLSPPQTLRWFAAGTPLS